MGMWEFISLTLSHHSPSLKEARRGTQAGQEPGDRSWCRGHGGVLLTGLLSLLSYRTQTTSPTTALPTVGCALPHWSLIEKMSYSWISWRHFLNWGSFFSDDLTLCQADAKSASQLESPQLLQLQDLDSYQNAHLTNHFSTPSLFKFLIFPLHILYEGIFHPRNKSDLCSWTKPGFRYV